MVSLNCTVILDVLQIVIVCAMCIAVYLCVLTLEEGEVAGSKHTRAHIFGQYPLSPHPQTNKKNKKMIKNEWPLLYDKCTSHFCPYQ